MSDSMEKKLDKLIALLEHQATSDDGECCGCDAQSNYTATAYRWNESSSQLTMQMNQAFAAQQQQANAALTRAMYPQVTGVSP